MFHLILSSCEHSTEFSFKSMSHGFKMPQPVEPGRIASSFAGMFPQPVSSSTGRTFS